MLEKPENIHFLEGYTIVFGFIRHIALFGNAWSVVISKVDGVK
jgi:hypothetical protein